MSESKASLESIQKLIETVHRLRAPGGCPWDRKQTHASLTPYMVEEAYEVLDVIDRIDSPEKLRDPKIKSDFREELGDVLMQVVLHSEMTAEAGAFDIYDVAKSLDEKLIRRHPHVFGEVVANDAEEAVGTWEKQKAKEKEAAKAEGQAAASVLDGVPKGLPALQRANRVIEKVTRVGFQWSDLQGPLAKLEEEIQELKAEIAKGDHARIEAELGDLMFCLCNVAFMTKVNPEDSLRSFLKRFEGRFRHVENRLREQGRSPEQSTLDEMDRYWDEAKKIEKESK